MRIRRTIALAVAGTFLASLLAACTVDTDGDGPNGQNPTPTPQVSVSVSVSPGPTVYTSAPEPTDKATPSPTPTEDDSTEPSPSEDTDEPTKPKASDENIRLSGTIIYVNRAGKCGRVLDVVVDTSDDDVRGIQAVHFHEEDGITIVPEDREIGDQLDIVIPPENFKPLLLESGKEPFPPASDMSGCDRPKKGQDAKGNFVLDPFYGEWIIRDLPYNGLTWHNRPGPDDS